MNDDNQNDFAIIHVRPGLEGKKQPVGTVAISLPEAAQGRLVVGYSIQHSKHDRWDGARGRAVAIGRAARGRSSSINGVVDPITTRRDLNIAALELVQFAMSGGGLDALNVSRRFRLAVDDTLIRLYDARAVDESKSDVAIDDDPMEPSRGRSLG